MTHKRVYLLVQTGLCAALLTISALLAVRICREGLTARAAGDALRWIFTREGIVARFAPLMPAVYATIGMSLAGMLLDVRAASQPTADARVVRDLLAARIETPSEEVQHERHVQRWLQVTGAVLFALCMVPVLLYVCQPAHFPEFALGEMLSGLLWHITPWTALGIAILAVRGVLEERSLHREAEALRRQLKAGQDVQCSASSEQSCKTNRLVWAVRIAMLAAAAAMILAGILNGSMRDVLIKAINLCTECVGLG